MANGAPRPGAAAALERASGKRKAAQTPPGFNADQRTTDRERTPVVIGGVTFTRRRKDWAVSRANRALSRIQETAIAKATRLRTRIAELEAEQIEHAQAGETELEAELEGKINELIAAADEATEDAELVTYRLIALLLKAPAVVEADGDTPRLEGFGEAGEDVDDIEAVRPAIEFLQPALDVEDAAALAHELTGSNTADEDPQTPTGDGSS